MKGVLAETFTNIIESKFVILHILQEFLSSVKLLFICNFSYRNTD